MMIIGVGAKMIIQLSIDMNENFKTKYFSNLETFNNYLKIFIQVFDNDYEHFSVSLYRGEDEKRVLKSLENQEIN